MTRLHRLAVMLLPGLDHFMPDLIRALPGMDGPEVRAFYLNQPAAMPEALAWADDPARDALWFEFCWPPIPALIARTDFEGRRVILRVHRIEAFGTDHAAKADWTNVTDAVVVSTDMAQRLRAAAPAIETSTRIHIVHNGVDIRRFRPGATPDPFRIGWCGWTSLHKNLNLALNILACLHRADSRYRLHLCSKSGDPVALDSFIHLTRRLGLTDAVVWDGAINAADMPAWHARNGILLSTSVYESFGYAIAEAAACGCDIAALDYPGAAEFWPEETRFGTVEEAVALCLNARPMRWHDLVANRFSLDRQVSELRRLLAPAEPASRDWIELARDEDVVAAILDASRSGRKLRLSRLDDESRLVATTLLGSLGYRPVDGVYQRAGL